MHLHFSEEDPSATRRARDLRALFVHAGHRVTRGPALGGRGTPDVWVHTLGWDPSLPPDLPRGLAAYRGDVVFAQLCDSATMSFHRIPGDLRARARWFLRNHWPSDLAQVPADVRDRLALGPPMLRSFPVDAGAPLADRPLDALFFGTNTGPHFRLASGETPRERTVRLLRGADVAFAGGLTPHADPAYARPSDLAVPRIRDRRHRAMLRGAKICIAPWGNHPITYRFFEGLAQRCLVVAQSLRDTRFLDGGLRPGVHYLEARPDLSDLVPVVVGALSDLSRAQRIADAGHDLYRRRLAPRGGVPSAWLFDETVLGLGGLYRPERRVHALSRVRSLVSRWATGLF